MGSAYQRVVHGFNCSAAFISAPQGHTSANTKGDRAFGAGGGRQLSKHTGRKKYLFLGLQHTRNRIPLPLLCPSQTPQINVDRGDALGVLLVATNDNRTVRGEKTHEQTAPCWNIPSLEVLIAETQGMIGVDFRSEDLSQGFPKKRRLDCKRAFPEGYTGRGYSPCSDQKLYR
jgi:hypothetical protein